ncbi:MAG TPA: gliding motility-associated C-terminal domain-containing protein, partial [Chitinophagaceae bacterium]|nr:gliding motility-associated C-terminal domain-containing protein [Chitinophagaceae bacterium]
SLSNYSIDNGLALMSATCLAPLFNAIQLKTASPMLLHTIYRITVNTIPDCSHNVLSSSSVKTGLPSDPQVGECVINEMLFDPKPGGYDYVEFYNNSNRIFDAARLHIASRNTLGNIGLPRVLSPSPYYILPGEWLVVTEDTISLARSYLLKDSTHVLQLPALPSFPDDKGNITVLNTQGLPVDEVSYDAGWHFKMITDKEGISLERINPKEASQYAGNWHSAASTAGYGTPGYKNSQYNQPVHSGATITVLPRLFSPDNDGYNDIAVIGYEVEQPGFIVNIGIYDAAGRLVRTLVNNGLLGVSGYWNWDGLNDHGQKIPIGTYVVFAGMYNLQGKKYIFKTAITLTRKH